MIGLPSHQPSPGFVTRSPAVIAPQIEIRYARRSSGRDAGVRPGKATQSSSRGAQVFARRGIAKVKNPGEFEMERKDIFQRISTAKDDGERRAPEFALSPRSLAKHG